MGIAIGHMPEVSYSFLSACDTRFLGDKACKLNDGSYYLMHVTTPTYFSIYENNLDKEVFTYKDGQMISDCLSAEKLADGSLDIYLPKNGKYNYDSDSTNISLSNVDPLKGEELLYNSLPPKGTI